MSPRLGRLGLDHSLPAIYGRPGQRRNTSFAAMVAMSIILQFVRDRLPNIFRYTEGIVFDCLCVGLRENHFSVAQINLQSRYQTLVRGLLHDGGDVSSIPFGNLIFLFHKPRFAMQKFCTYGFANSATSIAF